MHWRLACQAASLKGRSVGDAGLGSHELGANAERERTPVLRQSALAKVIGDCPDAEDIIDHLMDCFVASERGPSAAQQPGPAARQDCGKTVFNVGGGEGAHFSSTVGATACVCLQYCWSAFSQNEAELNMDPNLPKTEACAPIAVLKMLSAVSGRGGRQ